MSAVRFSSERSTTSGKRVKPSKAPLSHSPGYRVGDRRIVYAVIDKKQLVVIRGIVARKDLDKWLRSKK